MLPESFNLSVKVGLFAYGGLLVGNKPAIETSGALPFDRLNWHAWGCGYPMGLEFNVDGPNDAELRIELSSQMITGPMYGAHGEKGPPRRISFAPADSITLSIKSLRMLATFFQV